MGSSLAWIEHRKSTFNTESITENSYKVGRWSLRFTEERKRRDANDCAVMTILGGKLGLLKLGDQKWSSINDCKYEDVVQHKGKFYAVEYSGKTVAIGSDLKAEEIASPFGGGPYKKLVTSGNDLFLIDGEKIDDDPEMSAQLKVYKLHERYKVWVRVDNLNGRVFFVGDEGCYSVSAQNFDGLKGNCIYFSDHSCTSYERENLGDLCIHIWLYDMDVHRCGPLSLFPDHWPIFWPPPAWLKPNTRSLKKRVRWR